MDRLCRFLSIVRLLMLTFELYISSIKTFLKFVVVRRVPVPRLLRWTGLMNASGDSSSLLVDWVSSSFDSTFLAEHIPIFSLFTYTISG